MKKVVLIPLLVIPILMLAGCGPSEEELIQCQIDSDCVSISAGCCGCTSAGQNTAINNKYVEYWRENLNKNCQTTLCAQAISKDLTCFSEPKCIDNICQLIPDKSQIIDMDPIFLPMEVYRVGEEPRKVEFTIVNVEEQPIEYTLAFNITSLNNEQVGVPIILVDSEDSVFTNTYLLKHSLVVEKGSVQGRGIFGVTIIVTKTDGSFYHKKHFIVEFG